MAKKKIDTKEIGTKEIETLLAEKLYDAREDAWLSAVEWVISLKEGEKVNCQKAFEKYVSSLTS
tara:strand:+ start:8436 stop:8627 length:192 start_codon:yes stop_codon:yes gene_type:complete